MLFLVYEFTTNSLIPLLFSTVGLLRRYRQDLSPQSILVATADLICLAKYVMKSTSFSPVELSYNHILCCQVTSQQGIADKSLYIIIYGLCQRCTSILYTIQYYEAAQAYYYERCSVSSGSLVD